MNGVNEIDIFNEECTDYDYYRNWIIIIGIQITIRTILNCVFLD